MSKSSTLRAIREGFFDRLAKFVERMENEYFCGDAELLLWDTVNKLSE